MHRDLEGRFVVVQTTSPTHVYAGQVVSVDDDRVSLGLTYRASYFLPVPISRLSEEGPAGAVAHAASSCFLRERILSLAVASRAACAAWHAATLRDRPPTAAERASLDRFLAGLVGLEAVALGGPAAPPSSGRLDSIEARGSGLLVVQDGRERRCIERLVIGTGDGPHPDVRVCSMPDAWRTRHVTIAAPVGALPAGCA